MCSACAPTFEVVGQPIALMIARMRRVFRSSTDASHFRVLAATSLRMR